MYLNLRDNVPSWWRSLDIEEMLGLLDAEYEKVFIRQVLIQRRIKRGLRVYVHVQTHITGSWMSSAGEGVISINPSNTQLHMLTWLKYCRSSPSVSRTHRLRVRMFKSLKIQ